MCLNEQLGALSGENVIAVEENGLISCSGYGIEPHSEAYQAYYTYANGNFEAVEAATELMEK